MQNMALGRGIGTGGDETKEETPQIVPFIRIRGPRRVAKPRVYDEYYVHIVAQDLLSIVLILYNSTSSTYPLQIAAVQPTQWVWISDKSKSPRNDMQETLRPHRLRRGEGYDDRRRYKGGRFVSKRSITKRHPSTI